MARTHGHDNQSPSDAGEGSPKFGEWRSRAWKALRESGLMPEARRRRKFYAALCAADNTGRIPSFEGRDLSGWNLSGYELHDVGFRDANLAGTDLSDSLFYGTDFTGANLAGADLSDSDFEGTDFTGANLTGARIARGDISDARIDPEQLLDTRGLTVAEPYVGNRTIWEALTPDDPGTRTVGMLLLEAGWEGTLREVAAEAERILLKDPEEKALLLTLLDDWEGDLEEALAAAETLRAA